MKTNNTGLLALCLGAIVTFLVCRFALGVNEIELEPVALFVGCLAAGGFARSQSDKIEHNFQLQNNRAYALASANVADGQMRVVEGRQDDPKRRDQEHTTNADYLSQRHAIDQTHQWLELISSLANGAAVGVLAAVFAHF